MPTENTTTAGARTQFPTIEIKIGDISETYHLAETTAPKAYDGFGTFTVAGYDNVRFVLIRGDTLAWQTGRYQSGMHTPVVPVGFDTKAVAAWLWEKLQTDNES